MSCRVGIYHGMIDRELTITCAQGSRRTPWFEHHGSEGDVCVLLSWRPRVAGRGVISRCLVLPERMKKARDLDYQHPRRETR
jgi:hypothetical protein